MDTEDLTEALKSAREQCVEIRATLEACSTKLDAMFALMKQLAEIDLSETINLGEISETDDFLHLQSAKICRAKIVYIGANR